MDGGVIAEGEDFLCARTVIADRTRALEGFFGFFADPAFVRQMADQAAKQAMTIAGRDRYLRIEAYLPHCEAVRHEVAAVSSE